MARLALVLVLLAGTGCKQLFGLDTPVVVGDAATIDDHTVDVGDGPTGARKKAITIQGAMIASPLTDFPVWIALNDSDIAARASTDGGDIFFTDVGGVPLAYEIQEWRAGVLQAWVRVPTVAATANTTIYVRYGDRTTATPPSPVAVFSSSFVAVWHLDDSPTAPTVADATGRAPGLASGFSNTSRVPGSLGFGRTFDGTGAERISFTNPFAGSTAHTISAWVDQGATTHASPIVVVGTAATDQARFLEGVGTASSDIATGLYSDDFAGPTSIQTAGWTYVVWTYANKSIHLYQNGSLVGSGTSAGNANTTGTAGNIGYAPNTFGANAYMVGTLDEVRLATVARTPSWVAAEYVNQSSPGTFYTVGPEQPAP